MQSFKRKRRTRRDMVVLGGWLFADLLLGLAMLFAVANTVGQEPPEPTPTATPDELATAEAGFAAQQADNDQTVEALEGQVAQADTSAEQTQEALDEQYLAATEEANAQATRDAMSAEEQATADAQATEDAVVAQATIEALSTQQAEGQVDEDQLNSDLATSQAQATESAQEVSDLGTQQAELEAQATENASSGSDVEGTLAASETEVANAQATADASGQQVADAEATAEAAQGQAEANSLNPQSVSIIFQVDLAGVLAGNEDAIEEARTNMEAALAPYLNGTNCQIGFVNITSRANELGEGVQLSQAMGGLLQDSFPELVAGDPPQLAFEAIARPGTQPVGEVELQLFLNLGCQPA